MAHNLQERYSALVDAKLRKTLVTKDNLIFNTKYEGNPKAGVVKIPVRDTEVEVKEYSKTNGVALGESATTYLTLALDQDVAVNELIDGFDAMAVPDNIVADRLESASYSLANHIDVTSMEALMTGGTLSLDKEAVTPENVYAKIMKARTTLSKNGVPTQGRWLIASPETIEVIMQDNRAIKQGDLSQELVMQGVIARLGGFNVFESSDLGAANVDFICGHPDYCHRVEEWQVPVHLQDLNGSGKFIGASAVQGRKIYGVKVSKAKAVYVKKNA